MGRLRTQSEAMSLSSVDEDDTDANEVVSHTRKPRREEIAATDFESTKVHNGQLEFVLLTWCILDTDLRARLWPRVITEHFASDTGRMIYDRLKTLHQSGKEWPSLAILAKDPALPSEAQMQLRTVLSRADRGKPLTAGKIRINKTQEVSLENASDIEGHVFDLLESYRITRVSVEKMTEAVNEVADEDGFDPFNGPGIVERAATEILAVRGQESIADALMHFGADTTEDDDKKREAELTSLLEDNKPRFKTGIAAFDEKAGGIQPGEVMLMGAGTGGGKTAMAMTMGINMARMGTSSAMLQLELSMGQLDERLSAHLASVDSEIIRSGNIPEKYQNKIRKAWDKFDKDCTKSGARFTLHTPSSQTIAACEMLFKQYPYKVWFIDYVNLVGLDGIDKDLRGWEKLSVITKLLKGIAKRYNIAVVVLIQVNIDKDGNIEVRYAKAMKEDADIVLVWDLNDEAKSEGVVWVKHLKARQYDPFDFPMRIELNHFKFSSFEETKSKRRLGKKKTVDKSEIDIVQEDVALNTFSKKTTKISPPLESTVKHDSVTASDVPPPTSKGKTKTANTIPVWDEEDYDI